MAVTMTGPPAVPGLGRDWAVSVHLPGDPQAPRLCRRAVADAVREYGLAALACDGELVAGELMANAVQHGRAPLSFRVGWYAARARLRITVWDAGTARVPVRPRRPADGAESGRGLLLVAALAAEWGQYGTPDGGKAVWAELVHVASAPSRDGW